MKRAILLVAFGTTVERARVHDIDSVVSHAKKNFPDYDVHLAFTSRIIVKKLRERGEDIYTEQGALESLIAAGYEEIYVQPLHLIGGEEYDKLMNNVKQYEGQGQCHTLRVGRPCMYYMGQEGEYPDDYTTIIEKHLAQLPCGEGEGILCAGHGGVNVGNCSYALLQMKLWQAGYDHIRIITLENYPTIDDVMHQWYRDGRPDPKRIHVYPLLLVAGDHAMNDLFGEEDSLKCILEQEGYEVVKHMQGMGESPIVQDMYMEHLRDTIADRYKRRPRHRPVIPNVK